MRDTSGQDVVITPKRRLRTLVLGVAAVVALGAGATVVAPRVDSLFSADMSVAGDQLRFATVSRGNLQRDVAVQGQVVAANSPTLYAPAAGTVSLMIKPGNRVTRGQMLARVESLSWTTVMPRRRRPWRSCNWRSAASRSRSRPLCSTVSRASRWRRWSWS